MPEEPAQRRSPSPDQASPNSTTTPTSSSYEAQKGQGRRNNRNRRPGAATTRLQGACEELKQHVYDTSNIHASAELFSKTTTAIGEYIARDYSGAGEFRTGLTVLNLPVPTSPASPPAGNAVALEIWKLDIQEYRKTLTKRK